MNLRIVGAFFVFALASDSWSRIWFVAPSTIHTERLGTESRPLTSIQAGLDSARQGDTVLLEDGVYTTQGLLIDRAEDSITFGSRILLDGNRAHIEATILDGGSVTGNHFYARQPILRIQTLGFRTLSVVGFTIRNGAYIKGGAVLVSTPDYLDKRTVVGVRFQDMVFRNNRAYLGGAVADGSNVFLRCRFEGNHAIPDSASMRIYHGEGGAYAQDTTYPQGTGNHWLDCDFEGNRASYGGAVSDRRRLDFLDCRFGGNIAAHPLKKNGAGGAIFQQTLDTLRIHGGSFVRNEAQNIGGAMAVPFVRLEGVEVRENSADHGGAIFGFTSVDTSNVRPSVTARNSLFERNTARISGGAVFYSDLIATESRFVGNKAISSDAGALYLGSLQATRSEFRDNTAGGFGGAFQSVRGWLDGCLVSGGTALQGNIAFTSDLAIRNSTVSGPAENGAADFFESSPILLERSILSARLMGTGLRVRHSLVTGNRVRSLPDSATVGALWDVDPQFLNPAIGDLRLRPTSPAVDALDSTWDASLEPPCAGRPSRRDLGYYGNTREAPCREEILPRLSFEPDTIEQRLHRGERLYDSVVVRWSGSPVAVADLKVDVQGLLWGWSLPDTLRDGVVLRVRDTSSLTGGLTGTRESRLWIGARGTGTEKPLLVRTTLTNNPMDSLFGARWFGRGAGVSRVSRDTFQLVNRGWNPIRLDSARFQHPWLSLETSLAGRLVPAGDSIPVVASFRPVSPGEIRTRLVLYSYHLARPDTSVELRVTGFTEDLTPKAPMATIGDVSPRQVPWGQPFGAIGISADQDILGTGPAIAAYEWVLGRDTVRTASVVGFSSARLSLGWNPIRFRVRDNEGDWSPVATDSVFVAGLAPVVDTVRASKGILLRQDADLVLTLVAHDRDEFAAPGTGRDSIARVEWWSQLEGKLGSGAVLKVPSSKFRVANHRIWAVAYDDEGDSAISDTLRLPVQSSIGVALVVAGTSFGDFPYFQTNIAPNANWVYQSLRTRGFTDEQIWYANRIPWQSLDDPFQDAKIVDEPKITKKILADRIASLKGTVEAGTPLILAFVGHGNASIQQGGKFFLNDSEAVTPAELKGWLDTFDGIDSTGQIVVILDFCYSGAFQSQLRAGFDRHRVVVTSSDATHPAYFVRGRGFAQVFFAGVRKGRSVAQSFKDAKSWSDVVGSAEALASPLLNANMDASFNDAADIRTGSEIWIGGVQQFQGIEPSIDSVWVRRESGSTGLRARVSGDIERVWAEYRRPGAEPEAPPQVLSFRRTDSVGVWEATWSGNASDTAVRIFSVRGADGAGIAAFPYGLEIAQSLAVRGRLHSTRRAVVYDPRIRSLVAAMPLPAGETMTIEVLDLSGRRIRSMSARSDDLGWAEATWRPGRAGLEIVRLRWSGGTRMEHVLVPVVR